MSAIRAAIEEQDRRGGVTQRVAIVLADMPDDLRGAAEALLASHRSDRAVTDAFCDDGYEISQNAVRNYRQKHKLHRFAR